MRQRINGFLKCTYKSTMSGTQTAWHLRQQQVLFVLQQSDHSDICTAVQSSSGNRACSIEIKVGHSSYLLQIQVKYPTMYEHVHENNKHIINQVIQM